eukprot:gb/GEZN01016818.1/.p2 GENE.gb/GEZN01016818.1/~~gb/GEZN01016818.1/.p2  ORF type:complete len:136 (+),score=40.19 gb/GEZN01016818.1/:103-510(+)
MALSLFSPFEGTLDNLWHRSLDWDSMLYEPVSMDLTEQDKEFNMAVRPGPDFSKDKLDVTIEDDIFTVKGEFKQEQSTASGSSKKFSSFSRSIRLPDTVDQDKIKAEFKGGVLNITLPKKAGVPPQKKAKQITIA